MSALAAVEVLLMMFFTHGCLLPEVAALVPFPAALADSLDEAKGSEDIAVQPTLKYIPS